MSCKGSVGPKCEEKAAACHGSPGSFSPWSVSLPQTLTKSPRISSSSSSSQIVCPCVPRSESSDTGEAFGLLEHRRQDAPQSGSVALFFSSCGHLMVSFPNEKTPMEIWKHVYVTMRTPRRKIRSSPPVATRGEKRLLCVKERSVLTCFLLSAELGDTTQPRGTLNFKTYWSIFWFISMEQNFRQRDVL